MVVVVLIIVVVIVVMVVVVNTIIIIQYLYSAISIALYNSFITINILYDHPSHPRGGHPPHSNLVRGKLTSPTPTLQETGPTVLRPIREDEAM